MPPPPLLLGTGTGGRLSVSQAEGGAEGQVIAFLIAAGYYPSFGPSKKMPATRFSFQNDPVGGGAASAMGLMHKSSFLGTGVFPSGPDLGAMQQSLTPTLGTQAMPLHMQGKKRWVGESLGIRTASGSSWEKMSVQSTFGDIYAREANIRDTIIADVTNRLRGTLISKAARYRLRGNYVWWNSGVDELDTRELAESVYNYMTAQDPDIFEPKKTRDRKARAERLYDVFMDEFKNFEGDGGMGGWAADLTREMVTNMVGQDLSGEALIEYARETFENALSTDVPEEDDASIREYLSNVTYLKAEEQHGTSHKTDILVRAIDAAGVASEIEEDASESIMGHADERKIGKHGWITAFSPPLGKPWADAAADEPALARRIGDHMITEITESYNPVIRELIEYTRGSEQENTPAGQVPTLAQILGPKASGSPEAAAARPGRAGQTQDPFLGTPTSWSRGGYTGATATDIAAGGPNFLAAVQAGHFAETRRLMGTWPDAAHSGIMQYIFKMMSALGQDTGREFFQSQRITERDPVSGEAYYGFIPMSSYVPGDADFLNTPYEFRTTGDRSPAATFIHSGPSATLALLSSRNALNGINASFLNAIQHNFYYAGKAHSANVQLQTDGSLLSATDVATEVGNKHGFTISWSPKNLNEFFENFIQRIIAGMSEASMKTLADNALNPQRLSVNLNGTYDGFWGLPYIGFEDNLVRKRGEETTWFNEAVEKTYADLEGAPAPGGRWMSEDGRIYGVPG